MFFILSSYCKSLEGARNKGTNKETRTDVRTDKKPKRCSKKISKPTPPPRKIPISFLVPTPSTPTHTLLYHKFYNWKLTPLCFRNNFNLSNFNDHPLSGTRVSNHLKSPLKSSNFKPLNSAANFGKPAIRKSTFFKTLSNTSKQAASDPKTELKQYTSGYRPSYNSPANSSQSKPTRSKNDKKRQIHPIRIRCYFQHQNLIDWWRKESKQRKALTYLI